jgi:arsenate reductase-like glutaredoxin family protein
MDTNKFVANIIFRIRKIIENNSSLYHAKGNSDLDEIEKILEEKKDNIDKIINESQKIKKDIQEKLDSSKIKTDTMKKELLESLGVSNENN